VWKARHFPDERAVTHISVDHEYFLVYSRATGTAFRGVERDETKFSNPDNDPRGPWMSRSMLGLATREQRPNLHYSIKDPKTGNKFEPPEATGWRYAPEKMTRLIAEGCVLFPKKADGRPREKKFRSDLTSELRAIPSIVTDVHTSDGTKEIREIFGFQAFDFPKPADLIRRFVEQTTEDGDLVLDFFAGSGTTGHGVWLQNQAQSSNRRFILVQLDAPIDEKSASAKAILDAGLDTIDKITCERLRRVSKAMKAEGVKGDLGFRVFKEDSPALARPLHLAAEQLEKGQARALQGEARARAARRPLHRGACFSSASRSTPSASRCPKTHRTPSGASSTRACRSRCCSASTRRSTTTCSTRSRTKRTTSSSAATKRSPTSARLGSTTR
jgi:adenine-specific DNA-methyltransferase